MYHDCLVHNLWDPQTILCFPCGGTHPTVGGLVSKLKPIQDFCDTELKSVELNDLQTRLALLSKST